MYAAVSVYVCDGRNAGVVRAIHGRECVLRLECALTDHKLQFVGSTAPGPSLCPGLGLCFRAGLRHKDAAVQERTYIMIKPDGVQRRGT